LVAALRVFTVLYSLPGLKFVRPFIPKLQHILSSPAVEWLRSNHTW